MAASFFSKIQRGQHEFIFVLLRNYKLIIIIVFVWELVHCFCTDDTPTLLKLKSMKGADGQSLKITETVAAGDYMTFGMFLLQDENRDQVDLIKDDHIQDGAVGVTLAILKKWLTSGAPTRTYQHLIKCLEQSELGTLAEKIVDIINY